MKKGFTLIELLAVIVVLGVISTVATTTTISYVKNANKKSFLVEANQVKDAASRAVSLKLSGTISGVVETEEDEYCMTLQDLVNWGLWEKDISQIGKGKAYEGKVLVSKDYKYNVYMHNEKWRVNGSIEANNVENYNSSQDNNYSCGIQSESVVLDDNTTVQATYYQGINVNNYICFGTTDKNECVNNTDLHMYRIIGTNESGQMKLIKKEALDTAYEWDEDIEYYSPVIESRNLVLGVNDLRYYLNHNYFLTHETDGVRDYVPSEWEDRIATTDWQYNTLGNNTRNGVEANVSASEIREREKSPFTTTESETETNSTNREYGILYGIINAKIGLLNLSEYNYSNNSLLIGGGKNCYDQNEICKTSWLHLSNNDDNPPTDAEWLFTKGFDVEIGTGAGKNTYKYGMWSISSDGHVELKQFDNQPELSVRPVFYLTANQTIASGTGTLQDPYILSN